MNSYAKSNIFAARFLLLFLPLVGTPAQNDAGPTIKVEANVVLVPVVVRDRDGNAVANLKRDDFQLFDNGREQEIRQFTVEETGRNMAIDRSLPAPEAGTKAAPAAVPDRFVGLVIDDLRIWRGGGDPPPGFLSPGDDVHIREAARRYIGTLQPADRVAIFQTSGGHQVDFTADRTALAKALQNPSPGDSNQIAPNLPVERIPVERTSRETVLLLQNIFQRMAHLPGQRNVVFLSPGMALRDESRYDLTSDTMALIDRAVRSGIVIDSLDARGLYPAPNLAFNEFMARLADGTGGRFITDTNDMDGAIHKLAGTPKTIYVLGFSPEALKQNGSFHELRVKLRSQRKLDVQARKGYWEPNAKELARRQGQPPAQAESKDTPEVSTVESNAIAAAIGAPAVVAPPSKEPEISTRDSAVSFKVQTNLVEVPVVVRDREGHAVGNLQKDDFRVLDKGKRQQISRFRVEKAAEPVAPPAPSGKAQPSFRPDQAVPPARPDHYVAFVFDDIHIQITDLPQISAAVKRYLGSSLEPGDRVALFTTSGKVAVDFTTSADAINEALPRIRPSPRTGSALKHCLNVSYFQATQVEQQVSLHPIYPDDLARSAALNTAFYDTGRCVQLPDPKSTFDTAMQEIRDAFVNGKQETRATLMVLQNLVRHMALMPGQRSIILASPGFFVSPDLQGQGTDLLALAIRAKVLISTIDVRGVWTSPAFDASQTGRAPSQDVITFKDLDAGVNDDELIALAEGTGGIANLNNDFFGGVRKAAETPEYLYVLAFEPQNLKIDGSFHPLKVSVETRQKLAVQARRGYWAPKRADDPAAASKQEIENAVFSTDEMHSLPVELHTQLVKTEGAGPKLDVLASVDLKQLRLRKADDRNRNDVTIVASLFDNNGNFLVGAEKILQLRLKDETVQRIEHDQPITIKATFDVKPGIYVVRLVARDAEAQEITAQNGAVTVP
ncbi:MAG TPA: VWA domain-containing protein [Bryobacteraceae bacterium]|nr:VWA domain-containing protein [Bryobacteraceae bacterium]